MINFEINGFVGLMLLIAGLYQWIKWSIEGVMFVANLIINKR